MNTQLRRSALSLTAILGIAALSLPGCCATCSTSSSTSSISAASPSSHTMTVTCEGMVNGIDAQVTPGQLPRFQAFINKDPGTYIQVTGTHPFLLMALQTASVKGTPVEVTYIEPNNDLTRVRILDR